MRRVVLRLFVDAVTPVTAGKLSAVTLSAAPVVHVTSVTPVTSKNNKDESKR